MCTGECARFVGLSLIALSLVCIVANALLLVPNGETTWTGQLSLQVWLMGGFIGGGLMVLCPGIAAVRAGGKGCCGAGCCGNRCRMLRSVFSSALGVLGALYCLSVSGTGLRIGPKCLMDDSWGYHFQETSGSYLLNHTLWSLCDSPPKVVCWNVTLFSLLVAASCLELLLCGVQVVNATFGVVCGDCRKKRETPNRCPLKPAAGACRQHRAHSSSSLAPELRSILQPVWVGAP
ncbi:PREDICTED: transmembrane 4 L6 family member 5 [Miniopterus natalensis]|uniref:transmembrane 4 L6 family member 5 n=1 Tax=Miniopterus natalensis TaxID=291302 RepID=UPI0007A6C7C7|nr:PREDICTED: transmembrane 4 L6 family member 5 [Miniopterus natalensis]